MNKPKYQRILLKLSGEALASGQEGILNFDFIKVVAKQIKRCLDAGVEVAVIVGAGNIWRGRQGTGMDQCRADHMGMLATIVNSIALQDVFIREGMKARVMTSVEMKAFADTYTSRDAIKALESGEVVIFGGGLGIPFFSTDTAAALRGAEVGVDVIFKATNVDGVYDSDPKLNPDAKKFDTLSHIDVLQKGLHVMDSTAASLCRDNNIAILVFNLEDPENIIRAVRGESIGTLVKE